jgi:putative PIG3 family NAD(P)H quinone oxidoreductase
MKAVRTEALTGPQGLALVEVPTPAFGPTDVLIRVRATALNRADLLQTHGLYPAPAGAVADIPGLEYSGEVAEVGAKVTRWKVGDRVMGLVGGGAWAEYLVAHEREVSRIPREFSFELAAAIPEAFLTAWDALVLQAGLSVGSRVLIHAVASGVGTAAAQLCNLFGAPAVGTGRNQAKLARATSLGLRATVLVSSEPAFAGAVKEAFLGHGADIALDLVGGDWLGETIEALAPRGTLMLVGLVAGGSAQVPLRTVLGKRLRVLGTTMRARPLEEKIAAAQQLDQRLVPLFETKKLVPVVDEVRPMSELVTSLERLAANENFGKLVLTW